MNLAARSKRLALLASAAFFALPGLLMAQAGSLDTSFGSSGIVTNSATTAAAAALQSDGKIVVVGSTDNGQQAAILRYNTNGGLDSTFGTGGEVTFSGNNAGGAFAVAIESTGKILVAVPDNLQLAVLRLNSNGSLDTSFGSKGVATVGPTIFLTPAVGSIALESGGRILVTATSTSFGSVRFARLLSNGALDSTFGTDGLAPLVTNSQAMALQPSGQSVVLSGFAAQGAVSRYNTNGSLDTTFGGAGQAAGFGPAGGFAIINSSGEILTAGSLVTTPTLSGESTTGFLLVRYTANGSVDATFGKNGVVTTAFPGNLASAAAAVALESNGDVVAGGSTAVVSTPTDFALARYTASGTLDTTFGNAGLVTTSIGSSSSAINTLLIQTDGKILAIGNSSEGATIARYLSE
jgi:uncharacterized delta-60 repeat protein